MLRLLPTLIPLAVAACASSPAPAPSAPAERIVREGQIVCPGCWGEADRATTPYGSAADLECAAACSRRSVPPALAVAREGGFELLVLVDGEYAPGPEGWLAWMGKRARVTGRLDAKGRTLAVDAIAKQ